MKINVTKINIFFLQCQEAQEIKVQNCIYEFKNCAGENCFIWLGPIPGLLITDPDNVREVLSKSYIFQKPNNPLGKMLAQGLATYETDKWAKHKRLITPAFQLHKVKVHFLISSFA